MRLAPLALIVLPGLAAAFEPTVVVQPGESLDQVARRSLGDSAAADELRVLNRLLPDAAVKPGDALRVPGPEREEARTAVAAAESAVARSPVDVKIRQRAIEALARARAAMRGARYGESVAAARESLALTGDAAAKSRFTVTVGDDGQTRVSVHEGPPVVLEASQQAVPVAAGQSARVAPGLAPEPAEPMLPAPEAREPADGAQLRAGFTEGLVGPLAFTFGEVPGAARYVVVFSRDLDGKDLVSQHEVVRGPVVTALSAGRYVWRVSARGASGVPGKWSPPRVFHLEPNPPRLEVGSPTWK